MSPTQAITAKCGGPYPQLKGPHRSVWVHIPNLRGHTKMWVSVSPTQRATPKVWASVSPTQGATPNCKSPYTQPKRPRQSVGFHIPISRGPRQKRGSPYAQLKGAHQSVRLRIPSSRGHPKDWESIAPTLRGHAEAQESVSVSPTRGLHRSVGVHHPNSSSEGSGSGACGQLGAFSAHRLLGPVPLTTKCWPEAPLGGEGIVGVLGPLGSPPPPPDRGVAVVEANDGPEGAHRRLEYCAVQPVSVDLSFV